MSVRGEPNTPDCVALQHLVILLTLSYLSVNVLSKHKDAASHASATFCRL